MILEFHYGDNNLSIFLQILKLVRDLGNCTILQIGNQYTQSTVSVAVTNQTQIRTDLIIFDVGISACVHIVGCILGLKMDLVVDQLIDELSYITGLELLFLCGLKW